jgi:hypothetical protein
LSRKGNHLPQRMERRPACVVHPRHYERESRMRIKSRTSALIAAGMMATMPGAAIAQTSTSAAKLSVARAAPEAGDSQLAGGAGGVIAIAILAGIAAIAVLAAVNSDDDEPVSA